MSEPQDTPSEEDTPADTAALSTHDLLQVMLNMQQTIYAHLPDIDGRGESSRIESTRGEGNVRASHEGEDVRNRAEKA